METTVEVRGVTTIKVGSVNLKLDAKDLMVLRLLEEHKFLTAQQIGGEPVNLAVQPGVKTAVGLIRC